MSIVEIKLILTYLMIVLATIIVGASTVGHKNIQSVLEKTMVFHGIVLFLGILYFIWR